MQNKVEPFSVPEGQVAEENRREDRLSVPLTPRLRQLLEEFADLDQRVPSRQAAYLIQLGIDQAIADGRFKPSEEVAD